MTKSGALAGVRVLDVTQVMAGPYCAMMLADLGADVIKIEPAAGDSSRQMPGAVGTDSPGFNAVNRGKRSVVLDLKSAGGHDTLLRIAAQTDILIENYRPGVMDALRPRLRAARGDQSAADLRVDFRIWTVRSRTWERRLRPDRAGRCRASCP